MSTLKRKNKKKGIISIAKNKQGKKHSVRNNTNSHNALTKKQNAIIKKRANNSFANMLKFSSKIISILTIFCLITGFIIRIIPTSRLTPKAIANAKNQKGIIYLNPVAGGKDDGNVYKDRKSKDENLEISLKIKDKLEKKNYKVVISRNDDSDVKKSDRTEEANKKKCDIMVSIDRDKKDDDKASGINAFVSTSKNIKSEYLGASIINELNGVSNYASTGVLHLGKSEDSDENYIENSKAKMPSCMLLLGSISSKDDNEKFDKYIDDYAEAIANGIDSAYYKICLSGETINQEDVNKLSENDFIEEKNSAEDEENKSNDESEASENSAEEEDKKDHDSNYNNPNKYEDDADSYGDLAG